MEMFAAGEGPNRKPETKVHDKTFKTTVANALKRATDHKRVRDATEVTEAETTSATRSDEAKEKATEAARAAIEKRKAERDGKRSRVAGQMGDGTPGGSSAGSAGGASPSAGIGSPGGGVSGVEGASPSTGLAPGAPAAALRDVDAAPRRRRAGARPPATPGAPFRFVCSARVRPAQSNLLPTAHRYKTHLLSQTQIVNISVKQIFSNPYFYHIVLKRFQNPCLTF